MKIVVTGGLGLVGRNLREHPATTGWEVLAPARAELDLRDAGAVEAYLKTHRPDAVVHAAGRVGGIQANIAHPVEFLIENADIGRNVVIGARAAGAMRLLNLASSCVYPRDHDDALTEDMIMTGPLEPTNEGYALAKIMTLRLCQYVRRVDPSLDYKTLIPCNLYGRHDKFDPAHSHLIPAIIHKVHAAKMEKAATVEIWGDGTARREFMYAGDLADAIVLALGSMTTLPELMNVGLGHDHTILEYYAAAAGVIGWEGEFTFDLSRPVGMKRKLVDTTRQTLWGWQPSHTLRDGIAATYQHYRDLKK